MISITAIPYQVTGLSEAEVFSLTLRMNIFSVVSYPQTPDVLRIKQISHSENKCEYSLVHRVDFSLDG